MEKNPSRKLKNMKNNIENNTKGTLQGMRTLTARRGRREDKNGSNREESTKTKRPGVEYKKVYRRQS